MDNRFKKNNIFQRYYKYIILSIFVIIFVAISIFIIYKGLDIVKSREITYSNSSDIDYSVYLKDNDYFEDPYLQKGEKYISSLIDKIDISYNYALNSEESISGKYTYNIVASLIVKEQNKDDILWKKDFDLTNKSSVNFENQKTIGVSDEININYDYYNEMASSFKKDYGVLTDSFLYVKLVVNVDANLYDSGYDVDESCYVIIPLGEKTIEIEEKNVDTGINSKTINYTKYPTLNYVLMGLGVIFLLIYLYLGITVIIRFVKAIRNRSRYDAFIRKIFSNYDQIVISVDKIPDLTNIDVMEVSSFDDMIDAQVEVHKPIMFNEVKKKKLAIFILVDGNHAYCYKVRAEEFK